MPADPIARFRRWYAAATRHAQIAQPEAMTLATADRRGRPAARVVLLKDVGPDGFVFYTNADSRKGRELADNPRAALVFHWQPLGRQVRVEGRVTMVSAAEADAYWASRPRESQLGGAASDQSAPVAGRAALLARWRALARRYRDAAVPRPPHWTGYRVVPDAIEFWTLRPYRLHDRELFTRTRGGWTLTRLQP
ncbi:MAG: pyridoxamine 5'-phosphate oxidase [Deltaproteobacteria bacterium]|nr:pyridoxamine 5'-phosphate oxidase [Deltaproteobacteria bacterium]